MDSTTVFTILLFLSGGVGATLIFMACLASLVIAVGSKHYGWGVALLLGGPLAAVPFCLVHGNIASWPRGMLIKGLLALVPLVVVLAYFKLVFE